MNRLSISYRKVGHDLNADITGSLISTAALQLDDALHNKVDPWKRLIIDLTKVTDLDTTGLNVLYQTNLRCIHKNVRMILRIQEGHPIYKLMNLMHSTREFDLQIV